MKSLYNYWWFIIFLSILSVQGQTLIKNSIPIYGEKLIDMGDVENSKHCNIKQQDTIISYSAREVSEYTLPNNKHYWSFKVEINGKTEYYFLEQIVSGFRPLYYLALNKNEKKYFYTLINDSSKLHELTKNDYKNQLSIIFKDCDYAIRNIEHLTLDKFSLIRFYKQYESCSKRPLSRFRSGVSIIGISSQINTKELSSFNYPDRSKPAMTVGGGVFFDIPIGSTNLSFNPEIIYRQINTNRLSYNGTTTNDLVINYSSLSIPIQFKYTLLYNTLCPYIKAGVLLSQTLYNDVVRYEYINVNNSITYNIHREEMFQSKMIGLTATGGILLNNGSKHPLFVEFTFNSFKNINLYTDLKNISDLYLKLGFVF